MVEDTPVTCAFCRGRGVDPFGIMSPLSTCCVCAGRGIVSMRAARVPCRFCRGTGVYPHTRLTCIACDGVGARPVGPRARTCPRCLGRGADPNSETGLYCWACHGSGVLASSD